MSAQAGVIIAIAAVFLAIVLGRQARAWWKFRGRRVIACPENQQPVGVTVDAIHAAVSSLAGPPELRLSSCTRWPEKAGCGQPCLSQIAAAPQECLVRHILTAWYEGKACARCGSRFESVEWSAAKPALLEAGGKTVEWSQIPAEKLYETLAAAQPVCFACHMANTMVREHPELISDRSSHQ